MSKSAKAQRLLKQVASAPTSRRAQYSRSTREALLEAAEDLFTAEGYSGTSLDAVVAQARVTKGALYHHYSGKQGLFEAAFARQEERASELVQHAVDEVEDPWDKAGVGLRAFLEACRDPAYRRIVVQEGPAVLGYERFRDRERLSAYAIVHDIVDAVMTSAELDIGPEMVDTFTRVFHGAVTAAAETVVDDPDPVAAGARVDAAIGFMLMGMKEVAASEEAARMATLARQLSEPTS
ncbi:TetR/AcrR family transcriptional regulator [Nocardioidaceae bacterium]|nr:TetR/AcrR family transcriptional regulator [Nocardioidaceae bacterium]